MKTLNELGVAYGTDKADLHRYLDRYEPFLAPLNYHARLIVEAGVLGGASIRMWRDYFPNAQVIGIDHNPESTKLDCGPRTQLMCADVTDKGLWDALERREINLIDLFVDDASHMSGAVITTFNLVWPHIRPGGIYIIEDTHAGYEPAYNRDLGNVASVRCALDYFKAMIDQMNCYGQSQCGDPAKGYMDDFQRSLAFIHFSKSFILIKKAL